LDEGIYVLINALHAYEVLSQQFLVNYPSAFSIGINYKAQVKVWINDNWSINDQNQRRLSENYIIEEVVNIIEERMKGNFNDILNVTANYMNFSFAAIQDVLSKFTINYHRGKKSLEDRLNNRSFINDGDKSNIFS
jgi:UDP-N-acetylmuramoylalanine-D-glutamate ligase